MRTITVHDIPDLPTPIVTARDDAGPGGAPHLYGIAWTGGELELHFQEGPRGEVGENGITELSLVAVLIDRLEAFQRGPYASQDNAQALAHLGDTREALLKRHRERLARGVQGTSAV